MTRKTPKSASSKRGRLEECLERDTETNLVKNRDLTRPLTPPTRQTEGPPVTPRLSQQQRPTRAPRHASGRLRSPCRGLQRPSSPASSIFSSQTSQTGVSSSTSQTITQKSYNHSQTLVKSNIDVFSFLEQTEPSDEIPPEVKDDIQDGEADWDSDSSSSSGSCDGSCCDEPPLDEDTGSVHSSGMWDSGVSMSGDSPCIARERPKPLFELPQEEGSLRQGKLPALVSVVGTDLRDEKTPMPITAKGRELHHPECPPPAPSPPPACRTALQPHVAEQSLAQHSQSLQGYELLASKACTGAESDDPPPLYRRFATLQHRTLLHLQDTISELEAELKLLDEHIAHLTTDATGFHHPQSRRLDRMHPTAGSRRHQVLDALSHYIAQYNTILTSQQAMSDHHDTPSPDQIEVNKAWHRHHQPIQPNETTFLQQGQDLVLSNRRCRSTEAAKATSFIIGALTSMIALVIAMVCSRIIY